MKGLARPGFILSFMFLLAASTVPAFADHPEAATTTDLRELRTEVNRLDDSLQLLDESDSRTRGFREREQAIRDRLVVLRDEMRRHQQNEAEGLGASKAEVADLRRDITSLSRDIDVAFETPGSSRASSVDLPNGTEIKVRLAEPLSSKTSRVEERVVATVAEPVTRNGRTAVPAGTEVRGTVSSVQRAQRPSKGGRLEVSFDQMVMDGQRVGMDARVVKVEEGGVDKKKAGLGAVIGGVLGAVLDGKSGALIGAIVGGGGAVVASSGEEVELPAGTVLTVQLERPMTLARR
ncbi:MAG TPA: hypothetical protein VII62_15290 [Vicinamibacteria bacterium]|jgi:hypothetical protein